MMRADDISDRPTHVAPPAPRAAGPEPVPALSVEAVSHSYGPRQALDGVSFTVPPATFTALLGLNGAGKSTLFSLVTRLYGVQAGPLPGFCHRIRRAPR